MKLLVLVLMMCMSALSHADAGNATFADIQWGSTPQVVTDKLKALGFSVSPPDNNGVIAFKNGVLAGEKANGNVLFGNNKLLKVVINLQTADNKAISAYLAMKETLTKKYGAPDDDITSFQSPYYAGDGYEQQAIKLGKAKIVCVWGAYLALEITEQLTVYIVYESPAWAAESNRLKDKDVSVF